MNDGELRQWYNESAKRMIESAQNKHELAHLVGKELFEAYKKGRVHLQGEFRSLMDLAQDD